MNIRYSPLFRLVRKLTKGLLCAIHPFVIRFWPLPKVLSIDETLDKIIRERCSISRFGDGEFLYIIDRLNLPFQQQEALLRSKMIAILRSNEEHILVGLPIGYHSLENLNRESKNTWKSQIAWIYPRLQKYLDLSKIYANASITRVYMDYEDRSCSKGYFEKLMRVWENREVLLIEGEKSRLGVGNDLFEKAIKLERVIAPMHHAFTKYRELFAEALKFDKSTLILVALGPTATVLSYELAKEGYQAIDIGNVDIEYEWYLQGAVSKVKIDGKYTSEAIGGRFVGDSTDGLYHTQIVANFNQ